MYYDIPDLAGPFKAAIPEYVEHKRSLGYDYGRPILYRLREIDLFFRDNGVAEPVITEAMFEMWSKKRGDESAVNQRRRICVLAAFSKFLAARGYPDIHVGEPTGRPARSNFVPYIFSKAEITAIFATLRYFNERNPHDIDAVAFSVMFCLYYGCGLRKTEVQKLKVEDVDVATGIIRVLSSKGGESRAVAASESVKRQLVLYFDRFCIGCSKDSYLFRSANGSMYPDGKLYIRYRNVLDRSGIKPRENGRLPRLHDLRHTFCVHTLEAMSRKGFDLYVSLPLLVAYLGHHSISETEYYLRLVGENFTSVTDASHKYAPTLFPKVGDCYAG